MGILESTLGPCFGEEQPQEEAAQEEPRARTPAVLASSFRRWRWRIMVEHLVDGDINPVEDGMLRVWASKVSYRA